MTKYTIGVDFGTESGRALLVDVTNGKEIATAVYPYSHGVIDEKIPDTNIRLEPDWALQDPQDYVRVFKNTIPAVLKESGVSAGIALCVNTRLAMFARHFHFQSVTPFITWLPNGSSLTTI